MENQNVEYKSNWRDEYLKWICGFANAGGGKLLIGVDDNGVVVSKATAFRYLRELDGKYLVKIGVAGRNTNYIIK